MIPSLYNVIKDYSVDGRVNADAAFDALCEGRSVNSLKQHPASKFEQYMVDAFMFANLYIPQLMKSGCTWPDIAIVIERCLNETASHHGGQRYEKGFDLLLLYIQLCARSNIDNPKRKSGRFSDLLHTVCQKANVSHDTEAELLKTIPKEYLPEYISGFEEGRLLYVVLEKTSM